jgi:glycosyltransferase involved in cell wall biosynthesis
VEPQSSQLISTPPERVSLRPVNLLLDGRKLGDGGIGVYIENLVRGLLEVGGVRVSVLTHPDKVLSSSYGKDVTWVLDRAKTYSVDEMIWMPRRVPFASFDVFHSPHYTLPFGIPIPKVVTVHDLIHITHPERPYYPFVARRMIASALKRADKVIAVSRHTREQLLAEMGAYPERVIWVPNAVYEPKVDLHPPRSGLFKKVSEMKPYLLGVFSNLKPHKGFPDVIKAFIEAREEITSSPTLAAKALGNNLNLRALKLVLVGQGTEELMQNPELLHLIGNSEYIHVLGKVSADELHYLYARASGVVISSLAEGFCLPALEAQAHGTRVIARPVPAIEELATPNDCIARDLSVGALSQAIKDAVFKPQAEPQQVRENLERLQLYSLQNTAAQISQIYRSVVSPERA